MKHLIAYSLPDGSQIIVESSGDSSSSTTRREGMVPATPASGGRKLVVDASKSFEETMEALKPAAATIIEKIRGLVDQPDEVEVTFGLKLTADAGAVIASAGAEANYAVTLKWKKDAVPAKIVPVRKKVSRR